MGFIVCIKQKSQTFPNFTYMKITMNIFSHALVESRVDTVEKQMKHIVSKHSTDTFTMNVKQTWKSAIFS